MTDLFGHGQLSLFGDQPDRMPSPRQEYTPKVDDVRARLHAALAAARAAPGKPWDPREKKMWQTVFPNMANWLPEDEAGQLRFEFARELERLDNAA